MGSNKIIIAPIIVACLSAHYAYAVDYLSIEQSQKLSFPEAGKFDVAHVLFTEEQKTEIEKISGIHVQNKAQKIWKVFDKQNNNVGWFVVDYVVGKHLLIDYSVAISKDGKVLDVEILSYRESYGGEIRSKNWLEQFNGKTKKSELTLNQDITNIGGATMSSRHVTEGIKRILATIDVTQK